QLPRHLLTFGERWCDAVERHRQAATPRLVADTLDIEEHTRALGGEHDRLCRQAPGDPRNGRHVEPSNVIARQRPWCGPNGADGDERPQTLAPDTPQAAHAAEIVHRRKTAALLTGRDDALREPWPDTGQTREVVHAGLVEIERSGRRHLDGWRSQLGRSPTPLGR